MVRTLLAVVVMAACGNDSQRVDAGSDAPLGPLAGPALSCPPSAMDAGVDGPPPSPGVIVGSAQDFGNVLGAQKASRVVHLSNPSSTSVVIDSLATEGHGYSVTASTCGVSLAASAGCDVTVALLGSHLGVQPGTLDVRQGTATSQIALTGHLPT